MEDDLDIPSMVTAPDPKVLIYHMRDVVKTRESEGTGFQLRVPSLQIAMGEKIALIGHSGCGKSTLLDMLAFILKPTEASAFTFRPEQVEDPINIANYWNSSKRNSLGDLRKQHIGYVMQTGGLVPYLTVRENIALSRTLLKMKHNDRAVEELAGHLGIRQHLDKLPGLLSTGERQRVAIGRALSHRPSIVIADEPTASLDPIAAEKIMNLFIELVDELNITVIIASHAWRHIKRLGLRQLSHRTQRTDDGKLTETVVTG